MGMVNFTHDQDITVLQHELQAKVNRVKWEELKVKPEPGGKERLWEPKREGPAGTTKPNKKMREKYMKRNFSKNSVSPVRRPQKEKSVNSRRSMW